MPKFNLNPTKGVALKTYAKVRKSINGKRKTVRVDFTDIPEKKWREISVGPVGQTPRNKFVLPTTYTAYDILSLAEMKQSAFYKMQWRSMNTMQMPATRKEAIDLLNERFSLYMKYEGWKIPITYLYSSKSRVVRGTESLLAVRRKDGSKGWLTAEGRFINQDSIYQLMQGLDGTVASGLYDFSFADMWERMSAQQRADFVDATKDVDWDAFWELKYNRDNPLSDKWLDAFDSVAEALLNVVG